MFDIKFFNCLLIKYIILASSFLTVPLSSWLGIREGNIASIIIIHTIFFSSFMDLIENWSIRLLYFYY